MHKACLVILLAILSGRCESGCGCSPPRFIAIDGADGIFLGLDSHGRVSGWGTLAGRPPQRAPVVLDKGPVRSIDVTGGGSYGWLLQSGQLVAFSKVAPVDNDTGYARLTVPGVTAFSAGQGWTLWVVRKGELQSCDLYTGAFVALGGPLSSDSPGFPAGTVPEISPPCRTVLVRGRPVRVGSRTRLESAAWIVCIDDPDRERPVCIIDTQGPDRPPDHHNDPFYHYCFPTDMDQMGSLRAGGNVDAVICAVGPRDQVVCIGHNFDGVLGVPEGKEHRNEKDCSAFHFSSWAETRIPGVKTVQAGRFSRCALFRNGEVRCAGWLTNTPLQKLSAAASFTDVVDLAVAESAICVLKREGVVLCLGWDAERSLDDRLRGRVVELPAPPDGCAAACRPW